MIIYHHLKSLWIKSFKTEVLINGETSLLKLTEKDKLKDLMVHILICYKQTWGSRFCQSIMNRLS